MTDRPAQRAVKMLQDADRAMLEWLGIEPGDTDRGAVSLRMRVAQNMINSQGYCHGGFLYTLADTAAAYTAASVGGAPTTVDATIAYLRPARLGDRLTARATLLKAGSRVGHCDVRVLCDDELLAVFRSGWLL